MIKKIKEALNQFTFLSPKDFLNLASIIKLKQVQKGEHLVRVGEYNYQAMQVLKGLLCHYILDENGIERALLFVPEKMNSGSMQTLMKGKAADENIVALENTLLISVDIRELEKLAADNPYILKMINQSYKQIIVEAAERIKFLVAHSPEERYIHFCKAYPDLEQRIKQKHLASYLCITQSSLSRIRARIMNLKK